MYMDIETENGVVTVHLHGSLDSATAPQAGKELKADVAAARRLILDMKDLRFLSSAGLRLILKLHKKMKTRDGMVIRNINGNVREIFELTGFARILNIE